MSEVQIIVLAAGQGKRMGGTLPKALVPLGGKPMLSYPLKAIKDSGVCDRPVIVVGKGSRLVKKTFGSNYSYVIQKPQLGTGHAVRVAKDALAGAKNIMVLYGDGPLISPTLIKNLADTHLESGSVLTMATVTVTDFDGWRSEFKSFGKIVRDENGLIKKIVERKDANAQETLIQELNPAYYCFSTTWLWDNIEKLTLGNAQGEYYLTDLVQIAVDQGHEIKTVDIRPEEALGVNTKEQLSEIAKLL